MAQPEVVQAPPAGRSGTALTGIEARIAPDVMAVVKRAAEIQGRSLSDFVVAAAQDAAHRAIEEAHLIRLRLTISGASSRAC